ncbi:MAG TPA: hypothetical protein PL166_11445 [Candidatus Contendobacter sp.]|nr:hypothetical protein [Candidatus Contendobacter sp.]
MTAITCEVLFRQQAAWYQAQAAEGRLPKRVIGLTATGRQFEIKLELLTLGPFQKDKLIKYILETEGAECYAYATPVRVEDQETGKVNEQVLIVCASAEDYIGGSWTVAHAAEGAISLKPLGEWSGRDPGQTPGTWFLTDAIVVNEGEKAYYAALRTELREKGAVGDAG